MQVPPFGMVFDEGVSEDCLSLNVFARVRSVTDSALVPVIVFIHGGYGSRGGSPDPRWDGLGTVEMSIQPIVVVTFNYRLGILGMGAHPSLPSLESPPGIADQRAVLVWVREHIGRFGGDASRVTLAGWSFGSDCVSYHLAQRQSWPLYSRAVMLSAPGLAGPWYHSQTSDDAAQSFGRVASILGCRHGMVTNVSCMRAVPAASLVAPALHDPYGFYPPSGVYVAAFPTARLVERGELASKPLVIGFNRDEYCTCPRATVRSTPPAPRLL
jgi:para-nitrobenzyl esterase